MQVCITGGTGFVGSHLVRVLIEAGHQVRILHRPSSPLSALTGLPYESALGDVTDLESMKQAFTGCDWVFHVAAVADYWRADVARMFDVNVEGTRKVLDAARFAAVKRVVFTSSAAAVGLLPDGKPADETVAFNLPQSHFPYGFSKVLAEQVVQEFVAQGQDVVIVNPAVIMGAGDLNMISGSFIVQLHQWQWLAPATHGGVGVIDVRDVAMAHLAAAEKGRTGERYILSTANYSYRDWFAMICAVVGVAEPIFYTPTAILPAMATMIDLARKIGIPTPIDANQVRLGGRYVYFDASKMREELHTPQIEMRQSLQDTFIWYQANGFIKDTWMSRLLKALRH